MGEQQKAQHWQALGTAVTDRRVELGHRTLRSFAEASGLSTKTLGEIEGAKRGSYDRATLSQVERALRWPKGAVAAILDAGASAVPAPGLSTWSGTSFAAAAVTQAVARAMGPSSDDPDPLEAKLERLQLLAQGLNRVDLQRLGENVQMLIEWVDARQGVPEPTAEERWRLEQLQRATNAHNLAMRERRSEGASGRPSAGRRNA